MRYSIYIWLTRLVVLSWFFVPSSRNSVTAIFLYARQCVVNMFICDVGYQLDSRPDFCLSILLYFTRFKLRFRVSNHYTEKHRTGPPVFLEFLQICWVLLDCSYFKLMLPSASSRIYYISDCDTYHPQATNWIMRKL